MHIIDNLTLILAAFALAGIISALGVIINTNTVYAVLNLIACFISTAVIWLLNSAEFLAFNLIIVYVGAVLVLFLFVVMMLDLKNSVSDPLKSRVLKMILGVGVFSMLIFGFGKVLVDYIVPAPKLSLSQMQGFTFKNLARLLFTDYIYALELAGVLLLVAMLAALGLAYKGPRNRKIQDPAQQVKARKSERLVLVKMPSEEV
ncbi:MAG: NADH-quinone oxidoreductase subunit J [Gammaproteobacteria bacterium]